MHTPTGGQRDTVWVLQRRHRKPEATVDAEGGVTYADTTWARLDRTIESAAAARELLTNLRDTYDDVEFRAIRVETVQRVERW